VFATACGNSGGRHFAGDREAGGLSAAKYHCRAAGSVRARHDDLRARRLRRGIGCLPDSRARDALQLEAGREVWLDDQERMSCT